MIDQSRTELSNRKPWFLEGADGSVQIYLDRLLEEAGMPVNEHTLALAEQEIQKQLHVLFPGKRTVWHAVNEPTI